MTSKLRRISCTRAVYAAAGLLLLLGTTGSFCANGAGDTDGGPKIPDNTCQMDSDCQSGESCVVGLCLRRCSVHDVCDIGHYCSSSGFCEVGCRSSEECGEKLCARGACVTGSGTCVTKADCPSGLVCKDSNCVNPPPTCTGPEDCPDEQLCNGFTQVCFDPDPIGCNNAADCVGEAGCESGCTCSSSLECVTGEPCTLATEETACGVGGICIQDICVPMTTCSSQSDCDPLGLYCNLDNHLCQRTEQCSDDNACIPHAPATYCNLAQHRCEVPTCINGAITCTPPDECNNEGRCVPPAGASCSSNLDCCPDDIDNDQTCQPSVVEYCDIPAGEVAGDCRQGCRTDSDCNVGAGETCNALHQCATNSSSGGDGDPCEAIEDCRAGYFCGVFTKVCYEMCQTEGEVCVETAKTCTSVMGVMLCM